MDAPVSQKFKWATVEDNGDNTVEDNGDADVDADVDDDDDDRGVEEEEEEEEELGTPSKHLAISDMQTSNRTRIIEALQRFIWYKVMLLLVILLLLHPLCI